MEQEIITIERLSQAQSQAWRALFDSWLRDEFYPGLAALQYKQDCLQCGDIFFVTRFYVDRQGRVSQYEIVREEIDCRGKTTEQNDELRARITGGFGAWLFPPPLTGMIIEARMGQVTRC